MDRSAIATAVREYLNETSSVYFTGTTIVNGVNAAASKLNADAECNRVNATISIKAGGSEFSLTGTTLNVYRARLGTGSQRVKLNPTDVYAVDRDSGDWEAATAGTPSDYWTRGLKLGVYPRARARTKWTRSHAYSLGDIVRASASNLETGFFYKCVVAGTSAGTVANEPTWPSTIDATTGEGPSSPRLQWQQAGSTRVYLDTLADVTLAAATSTPSWCPTRYHRTIAKLAAVDLGGQYSKQATGVPVGYERLYREALQETNELRRMMEGRSKEQHPRITPTGYGSFRR